MNKDTAVFIVGGGPAGLGAAIAMRQKGFNATLADGAAPPIEKPCGEGLLPETLVALRDLGVELEREAGYPFKGVRFLTGNSRVCADFPQGHGMGIRPTALHAAMVERAEKCGVELLWKTPVLGVNSCGVQLPKGLVKARWIIGADGSGSRVRRWSRLDASHRRLCRHAIRRHYGVSPWSEHMEIYWGPGLQAYVTPVSEEEVCVVVMSQKLAGLSFERAFAVWPELRERLERAESLSRERGAISASHRLNGVTRGNVALVGDASGSVDAITGEGLRLSFRQALLLAEALETGDLGRYEKGHSKLGARARWIGRLMLLLGRKEYLHNRVIGGLSKCTDLFAALLALTRANFSLRDWIGAELQPGWQMLTK